MVTADSIRSNIEKGLSCEYLTVEGDGQHFEAVIVSPQFDGKSRVMRHQMVYQALGDRMKGEIHALSMKTLSPGEWAKAGH